MFPLAGERGFGEFLHVQPAQERHQLKRFGGGNQLAAFAQHVFFGDQAFNRRGAGRGRAQAFFLHGFAQLVVVDGFASAFHCAQQRGFAVARGRAGFERLGLDVFDADALAGLNGHQALAFVAVFGVGHFAGGFFAVNGQPAGFDQHFAFGFKTVPGGNRHPRRDQKLGAGEKHRHKAANH